MKLNGTIANRKVIFRDTLPGIEVSNDPNRFAIRSEAI
jgi:hypothetical protein